MARKQKWIKNLEYSKCTVAESIADNGNDGQFPIQTGAAEKVVVRKEDDWFVRY